jgi:heme a synthase
LPGVVTMHMLLTTGVLFFLLKALQTEKPKIELAQSQRKWIAINAIIICIQILMGTQVRENMDDVIRNLGENAKDQWIEALNLGYIIHRTFSWAILISHYFLWKNVQTSGLAPNTLCQSLRPMHRTFLDLRRTDGLFRLAAGISTDSFG